MREGRERPCVRRVPPAACPSVPLGAGVYKRYLPREGRACYLLSGDCLYLGSYGNSVPEEGGGSRVPEPPPAGSRVWPPDRDYHHGAPRGREGRYGGACPPPPRSGSSYGLATQRGVGSREGRWPAGVRGLCSPSGEGSASLLLWFPA